MKSKAWSFVVLCFVTTSLSEVVVRQFNQYEGSVCYLRNRSRGICRKSCPVGYWVEYKDNVCNPRGSPPLYCCVEAAYPTLNEVCLNRVTAREFELIFENAVKRAKKELDTFVTAYYDRYNNIVRGCKQMSIDKEEDEEVTFLIKCLKVPKDFNENLMVSEHHYAYRSADQDRSVALIGWQYSATNATWLCSGHFIHTSYILSSASCLLSYDLNIVKDCNGNLYRIREIIPHDQYDQEHLNDIAILDVERANKSISLRVFEDKIPTCLWTESEIPDYNLTVYDYETLICNTTQLDPSVCEEKFNIQALHYTNACFSCASNQDAKVTFLRHTGGLLSAVPYIFAIGSNKFASEKVGPMVVTKIRPYLGWIESVISRNKSNER